MYTMKMVRKHSKYRKASDNKPPLIYDTGKYYSLARSSDDRKTYASKVRSLIEKRYRSVKKLRRTNALKEVLSSYPRHLKCVPMDASYQRNDYEVDYDPDLEEVYESQKLNFRRMISNLSKHIYEDSDFDSWSDLESNFSLIYEPSALFEQQQISDSNYHISNDVDDVMLTLEKVKNMKNCSKNALSNPASTSPTVNKNWDLNSSICDSWSYCTCATSDVSSFLSTCSCCLTLKNIRNAKFHSANDNGNNTLPSVAQDTKPSLHRNDSWTNSEYSQIYEPVSADQIVWSSRIKHLKRKLRASSLQKSSDDYWDSWSQYSTLTSVPLPISSKEKKMKELSDKLKDDSNPEWESQDSVNLGLIYIPMDVPQKGTITSTNSPDSLSYVTNKCPTQSTVSKNSVVSLHTNCLCHSKGGAGQSGEEESSGKSDDFDPFGSLESLIFEPKESTFPDAIGRDNRLKASISISNISNRSLTEDTESTVTGDSQEYVCPSSEVHKSSLVGTSERSSEFSKTNSISSVGCYWDWGKSKAKTSAQRFPPVAEEGSDLSDTQRAPPISSDKYFYTDSSCLSEQPRSSSTSECKTCTGTSVASWTYIGLGKVVSKTNTCIGVNSNKNVTSSAYGNSTDTEGSPATVHKDMQQKKEVTWKIISEQNNRNVFALTPDAENDANGDATTSGLPLLEVYNSWSDLESFIFADEYCASIKDMVGKQAILMSGNRMNCYKDDWLFWDQQRKQRKMALPNKELTWRNKAKRMLLWMHYSQGEDGPPVEQWSWWKAKQRASILWLVSKANNNKVPDDLKDPYYRDHDDQDQLKPLVVRSLASAEYYCLALGNIYADPNYHNLNHWGVIQALARKGVYVAEPSDVALTETVLIQTSPIRMSAHMAVIEAIMALYLKETITIERIVNAVRRFVPAGGAIELPTDIEEALIFWINKVCVKMKHRIEDDMSIATPEVQKDEKSSQVKGGNVNIDKEDKNNRSKLISKLDQTESRKEITHASSNETADDEKSDNLNEKIAPPIPLLQDLGDLSDGCCLAAVISYYCPLALRWQDICLSEPMSMADSLYNLQLVQKFSRDHLPYDPCFLTLEDMVYQHSSVRQNILVFLAELFFLFEVRPAKCVKGFGARPEPSSPEAAGAIRKNGHCSLVSSATKRSFQHPVSPIPDLRSNSYNNFPDTNRISPKGSTPPHRESLLPRRQLSQHERMQERGKRFSFTDSSRGGPSPLNSMRRTHSMQDIDKNGAEKPYAEASQIGRDEDDLSYFQTTNQLHYPQRIGHCQEDDRYIYDDTSELYLLPHSVANEGEPLMPAIIKPAKEKSNFDSKPEEMGECLRQNLVPSNHKPRTLVHKRASPPRDDRQSSPQRYQSETAKLNSRAEYSDLCKNDEGGVFYLDKKGEIPYDYLDNKELEENQLRGSAFSKHPRVFEGKQPFVLNQDDSFRLKEGLESLGSSESGVFVEQDSRFRKDGFPTTSFAQLSKLREQQIGGINIVYMQHDREAGVDGSRHPLKSSFLQKGKGEKGDKKTSFAALPNQTTWQQHQGRQQQSSQPDSGHETPSDAAPDTPLASQLCDIRLKLEEKRRRIESEKRKMELMMGKMKQKVGKAAFLQAVSKGKTSERGTPDSGAGDEVDIPHEAVSHPQVLEGLTKTINGAAFETVDGSGEKGRHTPSPDVDSMNYDDYRRSIEQLTCSLGDLQSDVQNLTLKQEQIQQLMKNGIQQQQCEQLQGQFYLHDQAQLQGSADTWAMPNVQRSPPREPLYQTLQRTASREQLFQGIPRSQSIEQLYQPLQSTQPREPVYQSAQRSHSREQIYQPMQRSQSRELLYQPDLQRSASREQLYQPQSIHIPSCPPQPFWSHPLTTDVPPRPISVGPVVSQQHAYVDQPTYLVHSQPPPPTTGYPIGPQQYMPMNMAGGMPLYHNGPSPIEQYVHYGQYPHQALGELQTPYGATQMHTPYRLHIEVPGAMTTQPGQMATHGPSSRSQSPMTYHHQVPMQPPSRPPSRPPSTSIIPGVGPPSMSLPAKAVPITAPPESYMEPQQIHFIEDMPGTVAQRSQETFEIDEEFASEASRALASLDQAISGTGTYRVREATSPSRPVLGKTFRVSKPKVISPPPPRDSSLESPSEETPPSPSDLSTQPIKFGVDTDKGFFVSFDGEQPKRPKPPLRAKKVPKVISKLEPGTPEKEMTENHDIVFQSEHFSPKFSSPMSRPASVIEPMMSISKTASKVLSEAELPAVGDGDSSVDAGEVSQAVTPSQNNAAGVNFVIGTELVSPDPVTEDEMARKKERILMSVIKRKEQQEALRSKKELEAAKRREQERIKQEMLERKKEEERARKKAIFEQYLQRKAAMEEQENDSGAKTATLPKQKPKPMKPRPKSLHESALSAAEHRAADRMAASGNRGSQTNLAGMASESGAYSSRYRYADTDSGLGRATPPRRAPSPGQTPINRHLPSPTSYVSPPGSLPPGLVSRRMGGIFSDTASDSCSTTSSTVEYTGPKLFKQPTAKSNRGIISNAINTVLAGAVNGETKKRVLEEIARSESKHFLILFRDAGCQFRALYSYSPEKEEVLKLYGTGPKQVTVKMIDKFFKYNCGGRNFSEIQTKHLTVTIDAFTIHNSLWQGKRVLPPKKEFF